jgi:NAD(P)-dependent dehydrogenase (short-subunit alcohol dehydrogenase family)
LQSSPERHAASASPWLAENHWALVIDARTEPDLERAARELGVITEVTAIPGDVSDPVHRSALLEAAGEQIDLLVNNASVLGPSPQPSLAAYPMHVLRRVYDVNVLAPLALAQHALPRMRDGGAIINITSDAAVEAYEGWGGYGSSKAALEQVTAILGAEQQAIRVYAVDPGDMNTRMHQEAFPGEDISDRPPPEESVPGLMTLINGDRESGRYQAKALVPDASARV